ncbi:Uncharacterized protein FWK35_00016261 [Aphis craccivora]|uniref:Uncharacterized protein n=1 Tax=Aphis craccivora TaxID=307492 RepID=A0A6G0ZRM5_APHCR|nr:Uncharacterized protein FWK35_00016261 [Aphis craccivora]
MVTQLTVTHTVVGSIHNKMQKMCSYNFQFSMLSSDCAIRFPTRSLSTMSE